jgi:hypothetical protein
MRLPFSILLSLLVLSLACGDDDGTPTDAGGTDVNVGDSGGLPPLDAGNDAGNDAGGMDAGPEEEVPVCGEGVVGTCCFDVSQTIGDLPFVIPDTFDETTPTWNRPTDECPSEMLSEDAVPFVAYIYCNKSDATTDFQFEVVGVDADEDPMPIAGPVIVAYSGTEIPADPSMCGAFNEPLLGLAELVITLAPGEVVTIVSTTGDALDYGDIQSIAGEPTEE